MPHLLHHHPPPPPIPFFESTPPIPPRTRSRPSSRQQLQPSLPPSQPILLTPNHQLNNSHSFFRLDDLPSPDREWQLLENIGDGTYGEVFRVSY